MLRFFRHLRRKLLEQNKVASYLKYALGEILLVVVGILLALQVNNWNEVRKQQDAKQSMTESLLAELAKDSTALQKDIARLSSRIAVLEDIKSQINQPLASTATVDEVLINQYNPSFVYINKLNKNTFSILSSTGQLAYFSAQDADKIQNYYQRMIDIEEFEDSQLSFYKDIFSQYLTRIPVSNLPDMQRYTVFAPGHIKDELWKDVDMGEARLIFGGITSLQTHIFMTFRSFSNELLALNGELQQQLKKQ